MPRSRPKRRSRGSGRRHGSGPGPRAQSREDGGRPRNGAAAGRGRKLPELCALGPFSAFCALYLGITEDEGFARPEFAQVARRFELSVDELECYLREQGLSSEQLAAAGFDVDSARLDIEVAPEGISRVELARTMFEEVRGRPC